MRWSITEERDEIFEEGTEGSEELLDDGVIILEISDDDDFEELEFIELTEEEILEIEKEMEIEAKELEILDEEVVVPVILTRIVSMAAFIMRKS